MSSEPLAPPVLAAIADRFKALGDPGRLALLQALRPGPATVGELVSQTGLGLATVSKQLQQLHRAGFLARTKTGLFVQYRLSDPEVLRLCDVMCARVGHAVTAEFEALGLVSPAGMGRPARGRKAGRRG